eukprot:TRINITY_DN1997_c0_g1_i2.p1 TRINITY_DN1997_c0_g1~~TRINITY_DN1997_c0_g1_i2.p1  ORF type:complete len:177 (-),score=15.91 TRINITY_DN1997_c0_g1_i2:111-614(-)
MHIHTMILRAGAGDQTQEKTRSCLLLRLVTPSGSSRLTVVQWSCTLNTGSSSSGSLCPGAHCGCGRALERECRKVWKHEKEGGVCHYEQYNALFLVVASPATWTARGAASGTMRLGYETVPIVESNTFEMSPSVFVQALRQDVCPHARAPRPLRVDGGGRGSGSRGG